MCPTVCQLERHAFLKVDCSDKSHVLFISYVRTCVYLIMQCTKPGGSATRRVRVQDFKIPRFYQDLKIKMRFKDFKIKNLNFQDLVGFAEM